MSEHPFETLDEEQCQLLLGSKDIGRITFSVDGVPTKWVVMTWLLLPVTLILITVVWQLGRRGQKAGNPMTSSAVAPQSAQRIAAWPTRAPSKARWTRRHDSHSRRWRSAVSTTRPLLSGSQSGPSRGVEHGVS